MAELFANHVLTALPVLGGVVERFLDAGALRHRGRGSQVASSCVMFAFLAAAADRPDLFERAEAAFKGGSVDFCSSLKFSDFHIWLVGIAAAGASRGIECLRSRGALEARQINFLATKYANDDHFRCTNMVVAAAQGGHAAALKVLLAAGGKPDGIVSAATGMYGSGASELGEPLANAVWGARGGQACDGGFAECVDALLCAGAAVSHVTPKLLEYLRRGSYTHDSGKGSELSSQLTVPDAPRVLRALVAAILPKARSGSDVCDHCHTACKPALRCARCHATQYCGRDCQRDAWSGHKAICHTPPPKMAPARLVELLPLLVIAAISWGDFETSSVVEAALRTATTAPSTLRFAPDEVVLAAALSSSDPFHALDYVLRGALRPPPGSKLGPSILVACIGGKAEFQRWTGSTNVSVHPIPRDASGCVRPEVMQGLERLLSEGFLLSTEGVSDFDYSLFQNADPPFMRLLATLGVLTPEALNATSKYSSDTALSRCINRARWDKTDDARERRTQVVSLLVAAGATAPQLSLQKKDKYGPSSPFDSMPEPHHDADAAREGMDGDYYDY